MFSQKKGNSLSLILITAMVLVLVVPGMSNAQIPRTISHQGFITDSGGNPVDTTASGPVQMIFTMYDDPAAGTSQWTETQLVTVNQGVYSVVFGSNIANPLNAVFDVQYYLDVQVETAAGSGIFETLSPRQPLSGVPYAINADTVDGQHASDLGDITGVTAGTGLNGGGASGDITLNIDVPLNLTGSNGVLPTITSTNDGSGYGVWGRHLASGNVGYLASGTTGVSGFSYTSFGVEGQTNSATGIGVNGRNTNAAANTRGYLGGPGNAVYGIHQNSLNQGHIGSASYGVYGYSGGGKAGFFEGDTQVTGDLQVDGVITGGETDPTVNVIARAALACTQGQIAQYDSVYKFKWVCADNIHVETDPEVGLNALNYLSKWDGTALVQSAIFENNGKVGLGTATPQTALDINGTVKLAKQTSEPYACDTNHAGAITLTGNFSTCTCNGIKWVSSADGKTDCVWVEDFTNSLGMTFRLIPAGSFTMGSPDGVSEYPIGSGQIPAAETGRFSNETPHLVTISQPYYMMTTEVTQGQWNAVMGPRAFYALTCGKDCPAENVSWDDAQAFIAALNLLTGQNYRLPTEAEWEYAARAGTITPFYNGASNSMLPGDPPNCDNPDINLIAWYCFNSIDPVTPANTKPFPVATKQPNAWGLYDMAGNVDEWCQDWHDTYPSGPVIDPQGPASGSTRVIRGGSHADGTLQPRSAFRGYNIPTLRSDWLGFRLVLPVP